MPLLRRLRPKVKIQDDFYVFDVETKVSYQEWLRQRKIAHNEKQQELSKDQRTEFVPPAEKKGIYFGLSANPKSFQFGVIYGLNYCKVFHSLTELIYELKTDRFKGKTVFAHNATYDLTTLFGNIYSLDPCAIFNGSRFIRATNGVCIFADSYNILATSVTKIGALIGIKKPDLGDDYFAAAITPQIIERAVKDCQIVYQGLISVFEMAGDIKITQASLSMTYFRRFHQPFDIEHNQHVKHFWESYYGGRCEAFKIGNVHAQVIDANSAYPYSMKECVFPNPKYLKDLFKPTLKLFNHCLNEFEGCAYVKVRHKKTPFGYLPYKKDGKLFFPVGTFSGCWNLNELRYGIEQGIIEVLECQRLIISDRMQSIFAGYVDYLYNLRTLSKDDFEIYRIKIFMNSLYGKFAQRIYEETIYISDIEKDHKLIEKYQQNKLFVELKMYNEKRKDAQLVIRSAKFANLSYSIPSFASYVTSFWRVELLKKLNQYWNKGVVYCDTDSLFVTNAFGIKNESHLGGWKQEGDINEKSGLWQPKIVTLIRGLKNYVYHDPKSGKIVGKTKGVPAKAIQLAENSYQYFNLLKTKEALRRGIEPGELVERRKELTGEYNKRIVFSDGETKPIEI